MAPMGLQPLGTVLCCWVALCPSLHCMGFPVSLVLAWQRNPEAGILFCDTGFSQKEVSPRFLMEWHETFKLKYAIGTRPAVAQFYLLMPRSCWATVIPAHLRL